MAEGIIFGKYFLDKEQFMQVFMPWYEQRYEEFKIAIQEQIIKPLEQMWNLTFLGSKNAQGQYYKFISHNKNFYSIEYIYLAWTNIAQEYFGNGEVNLMVVTNLGNETKELWSNIIPENSVMNEKDQRLNISTKKLKNLEQEIKNVQACQAMQDLLHTHYSDLIKTLDSYTMNKNEAHFLHLLLARKKSRLVKGISNKDHFTNKTYNETIYNKQQEGKKADAFMNHMADMHSSVFRGLNRMISVKNAENIVNSIGNLESFNDVFKKYIKTQYWLYDSLNTTSWLTGGDIVVVNEKGKVIYNIQLKATIKEKGSWELSSKSLLNFAQELVNESYTPKQLAEIMYENLKTQTSNQFKSVEDFYEQGIYKLVADELKLEK